MDANITIKNYRCFSDENPARIEFRRGISAIVGPNNSGKSSLLKIFHEIREILDSIYTLNSNFLAALREGDGVGFNVRSVLDQEEVFYNKNERDISIEIEILNVDKSGLSNEQAVTCVDLFNILIKRDRGPAWVANFKINKKLKKFSSEKLKMTDGLLSNKDGPVAYFGCVKEFAGQAFSSIYIGPYRNAINVGGHTDYYDLKIGEFFIKEWNLFKTGPNKKRSKLIASVCDDIKNIFGFDNLEINASSDGSGLKVVLDKEVYSLNELGAGISQFVIVLATAAIKAPAYIFIDEPELNLHPSLQLSFLTALASYAKQGVIFATHSIGLARSSADSIYTVRKSKSGLSILRSLETDPELPELLGELSFSSYKELGFDKVLLVEGVTEVKAIQQILRRFRKDQEFILLPLGGSALVNQGREHELSEIKRISSNVFALVDSEKESEDGMLSEDRQGFVDACNRLKIDAHVLERRALENYWTDRAIKAALGKAYKELAKHEKLGANSQGWQKSDNWRIAREMTQDELLLTDLGRFLSRIVSDAVEKVRS